MNSPRTDEALMQAVTQGDFFAFEQLVRRHQEPVWRTAYRMLGSHADAEDIAQQAFLKIFEARERYRPTAAFRTYLYRIVVRLCLDRLRKKRPVDGQDLSPVDPGVSPVDQAADAERSRAVQQAIARLPARQRAAVVLRYYESLASREIAAAMDTSQKAVERLLARARDTLEVSLRDFL
jgi:RNA polymerase sigma-70 factor (ECF subfamily)